MDYIALIRQLQVLLDNNLISLLPLVLILINIIIFIISRTFRKTGLFVIALAFLIDYTIKSLPLDLYLRYPWLYNTVTVLYILGFILFFLKILKIIIRINSSTSYKNQDKSKFGQFLKFTGMSPFLLMLLVNIIDINKTLPQEVVKLITSITFLYMIIKTSYHTYQYLKTKESIVLADKMDFREIKEFLNEDSKVAKSNSKNQGRRIRKTASHSIYNSPTELIDKNEIKKNKEEKELKIPKVASEDVKVKYSNEIFTTNKLSNTELLRLVTSQDRFGKNKTTIIITNLSTSEKMAYTSTRPDFSIHENTEYKVDLEFENINEYDYGKFIDILLVYSKNKDLYKFELIVQPLEIANNKMIFYDPSNIYDIDEKDYQNVGGKIISMNFPKYKINFISGN